MYPEDYDFPNGCPMCRFFPMPPPPPGGMGGPQGSGPPSGPPPAVTPSKNQAKSLQGGPGVGAYAVDPGAIRFCRFRYTYIWLRNGRSFWIYPVFVGRNSISGWRWNGRFWVYFGIDLRRIDSFVCY